VLIVSEYHGFAFCFCDLIGFLDNSHIFYAALDIAFVSVIAVICEIKGTKQMMQFQNQNI
jgi:hypothetical protein